MQEKAFTIEVLEERIAPSAMSIVPTEPSSGDVTGPGIGADPGPGVPWHSTPPSPGQWPVC